MNGIFLEKNRERILAQYEELKKALPERMAEVDEKISQWEDNTALACKYMYITMPYSDIANYEPEIFKDYGENAVWLWENRAIVKRAKRLSRGNIHFAINLDLMKNTTFLSGWIAKTVCDFLAFFYQQNKKPDRTYKRY